VDFIENFKKEYTKEIQLRPSLLTSGRRVKKFLREIGFLMVT